jgi:cystathionine beta-lyase
MRRHGWYINTEWLTYSPGVVTALNLCIITFSQPGDGVIIQPPVYYPFFRAIKNNGRSVENNPLIFQDARYFMDIENLNSLAKDRTRLMIISNPHNPVGRVWKEPELRKIGEFCVKNDVILISDEVHSDIVYSGYKHIPVSSLSEEIANQTITCIGPSKTFNLAGLKTSSIIIPNPKLRKLYNTTLTNLSIGADNSFGLAALEAAYRHGDEWLTVLLEYLEANMDFAVNYFQERIPKIKALKSEGTYLMWLDCRELGHDKDELDRYMREKAKVWFDDGPMFGPGGEGFQRINIACPRSILEEALKRIEDAVSP